MRSIRDMNKSETSSATSKNNVQSVADKYAGKSESELMSALMQNVSSAKSNGTFSVEQLDEFEKFVAPSLDEASRRRLDELVRMIKGS